MGRFPFIAYPRELILPLSRKMAAKASNLSASDVVSGSLQMSSAGAPIQRDDREYRYYRSCRKGAPKILYAKLFSRTFGDVIVGVSCSLEFRLLARELLSAYIAARFVAYSHLVDCSIRTDSAAPGNWRY